MEPGFEPSGQDRNWKLSVLPELAEQTRATAVCPSMPRRRLARFFLEAEGSLIVTTYFESRMYSGRGCFSIHMKESKLTTRHIIAGNVRDWKGCLLDVLVHPHARPIALRRAIDKKIRKDRVRLHEIDGCGC